MAIVREIKCPNGATVAIHDDAYRDASPEEIQRRWDAVGEAIRRIDRNAQRAQRSTSAQAVSGQHRHDTTEAAQR